MRVVRLFVVDFVGESRVAGPFSKLESRHGFCIPARKAWPECLAKVPLNRGSSPCLAARHPTIGICWRVGESPVAYCSDVKPQAPWQDMQIAEMHEDVPPLVDVWLWLKLAQKSWEIGMASSLASKSWEVAIRILLTPWDQFVDLADEHTRWYPWHTLSKSTSMVYTSNVLEIIQLETMTPPEGTSA